MSTEKLVKELGKYLDRRKFLTKLGVGTLGGLLGLLGWPQMAEAGCCPPGGCVSYYCCTLCKSPSGSCSNCDCVWCWTCLSTIGRTFRCCECNQGISSCGPCCDYVTCSWAQIIA